MPETHALAIQPQSALPTPAEWQTVIEMARMMVPTGLLPASIKTPEQAVLIVMKGRELRVPPMHALAHIVIVQGKPACSAELMLALIYRDFGDEAVIVEESTATACRLTYKRPGWRERRSFGFTIEDARTAGLAGKGTWAQYPQAMLRARAVSAVARLAFPDSIAGMHMPEELGATVAVTGDGSVEVVEVPEPPPTAIEPPPGRSAEIKRALEAAIEEADAESASLRQELEDEAALALADRRRAASVAFAPADDVELLVGKALGDACARMRRSMEARSLPLPPDPVRRNSNEAWRRWWHACRAVMNAAEAAAPHGAPQGVAG